jgi:eukaryotic-like serine/threonine-protein kinase
VVSRAGRGGAGDDASRSTGSGTQARPPRRVAPISAGSVLQGRYRITGVLGAGGMSTVYKALDLRFPNVERVCAVKEMFDGGGDETTRQGRAVAFEREAGLLAILSHPLIPKIFDYFSESGNHYLVQEFIPGQNLETLLENAAEGFLESELIDWAVQICDVLAYLHGQQPDPIIFRDLKPSNVMIRDDRSLMLIDFGIARAFQQLQRGTMIGTEGYAPPEQYRGVADARTDIYALGATLHHLTTRIDPRFETPFTFDQRAPRDYNSRISLVFERAIMRALAYRPNDRYTTAAEFKAALLRCRGGGTRLRGRPTVSLSGPLNDNSGGLVAAPVPAVRARPLPSRVRQEEQPPAPVTGSAAAHAPAPTERLVWSVLTQDEVRGGGTIAGDRFLIGSYDARLHAIGLDGTPAWQFTAGRGICSTPASWRDLAIVGAEDGAVYGLALADGRLKWRYRTSMAVRSSPQLTEDGNIIIGSDDSFIYNLAAANGAMLWRYRAYGPVRSSAALTDDLAIIGSDDGFLYALAQDSGRQVWRFATGKPIFATPAVYGYVVVCGSLDGSIYGLDLARGEFRWRVETGGPVVASAVLDGGCAYVGTTGGRFLALDLATGERVWEVPHGGRVSATATLTVDRVYYGALDGAVYCLDRATGAVVWSYVLGKPLTGAAALTPAGDLLLIGGTDGKIHALATGELPPAE